MRSSNPLLIALVCGTLLLILTAAVWFGVTDQFDIAVRELALNANPAGAETVWKQISSLGSAEVIVVLSVLAVFAFALLKKQRGAIHFALVMIGGVIIEPAMKLAVHRPRPAEVFANTLPSSFSFPSGHTLFATAFYGSVALIACKATTSSRKRTAVGLLAIALILAIGISRIFLGVHYPTDVLGGYLAAVLWIAILKFAAQKYVS